MKILVDISHPAHVHLFKYFIWEMQERGHQIMVTARDKDVTLQLLDEYHIVYVRIGKKGSSTFDLITEFAQRELKIYQIARKFKPDFLLGLFNPAVAHVATLIRRPSLIFIDTEPKMANFVGRITIPFASVILTPDSIKHHFGPKEVRINSFKELASLHPDFFSPDPLVLKNAGIGQPDSFALIRFVSWGAYHDIGYNGFSDDEKYLLIKKLEEHLNVYISSESPLPEKLEKYHLPVSPNKIHDVLYYARLLVTDSATMTTEAAMLGTPVVRCSPFVGQEDMGNFIELEKKYGLIMNYNKPSEAIDKSIELVQNPHEKQIFRIRQKKLLEDKVSITPFMVWFVENYPESFKKFKKDPGIQYCFR